MLSLVLTYDTFISLVCTRSRIKWYLMSICLTREWSDGSSDKLIAELLSQLIVVGSICLKLIPSKSERIQIASFVNSDAATYSASHDEVATVFCFLAFHEISPEPSE